MADIKVRNLHKEFGVGEDKVVALENVNLDWDEPSKIIRLSIDQDRARVLGVSSQDLANFLQSSLSGTRVSLYREGDELIEMLLRGPDEERAQLSLLESLAVPTATGPMQWISVFWRLLRGIPQRPNLVTRFGGTRVRVECASPRPCTSASAAASWLRT